MNRLPRIIAVGLVAAAVSVADAQAQQVRVARAANESVVVMTRGPLHEAFAEPYVKDTLPGLTVDVQPPQAIDEVPPQYRPTGRNVVWVPGYWGWDDERQDFIWISGIWRAAPPGHRWVPGYWTETRDGYQWVTGFWGDIRSRQLVYLPYPPEAPEIIVEDNQPAANHFWVPGRWMYQDGRYVWREGYWAQGYDEWVWVPARYIWTPAGCVFRNGYWDHPLPQRGVLFAPVYFEETIYLTRGYRYRPSYVIDVNPLLVHLFVRPTYHHYYFGDYYDTRYQRTYIPWVIYPDRHGYDPLHAYYRWQYGNRRGVDYIERLTRWYSYYERNESYRPPRTWAAQRQFASRYGDSDRATFALLGNALDEFVQRDGGRRFDRLAEREFESVLDAVRPLRQLSDRRMEVEVAARGEGDLGAEQPAERARLDLPELPPERVEVLRPQLPGDQDQPPAEQPAEPDREPGQAPDEPAEPAEPAPPAAPTPVEEGAPAPAEPAPPAEGPPPPAEPAEEPSEPATPPAPAEPVEPSEPAPPAEAPGEAPPPAEPPEQPAPAEEPMDEPPPAEPEPREEGAPEAPPAPPQPQPAAEEGAPDDAAPQARRRQFRQRPDQLEPAAPLDEPQRVDRPRSDPRPELEPRVDPRRRALPPERSPERRPADLERPLEQPSPRPELDRQDLPRLPSAADRAPARERTPRQLPELERRDRSPAELESPEQAIPPGERVPQAIGERQRPEPSGDRQELRQRGQRQPQRSAPPERRSTGRPDRKAPEARREQPPQPAPAPQSEPERPEPQEKESANEADDD